MKEDFRGSGEISLTDLIYFLERRWRLIVGLALAWGAVAVLLVLIVVPRKYTTAATLLVVPPGFASRLSPKPISLQGFQTLLESGSVIAETQKRLNNEGVLAADEDIELGEDIESEILETPQEEGLQAPVIKVLGRAETPDKAARIANTWAEVYLEFSSNLVTQATTTTVNFIEEQYPEIDRELIALEDHLVAAKGEYQKKYDQVADGWDKRIAASRQEMLDKITAFQLETRAVMDALVSDQMETLITNDTTEGDIKEKLLELASIRTELAQTLAVLKLEKEVSSNALWQSAPLQDLWDENLSSVREGLLATQEVNPVYGELALRAVDLETELKGLGSAQARALAEGAAALEKGQRERSSGLAKLQEQRALELVIQRRRRQRELDSLQREQEAKVDRIEREIKVLRGLHQRLADNYNEAVLAKAQEDIEVVHLASRAEPVENEEPRRVLLIGALGTILGGILGSIIGMVLDVSAEAHSLVQPAGGAPE